ncbi:MAG: hypothetical protein QNJ13_17180 [Paracoccaceae bacterium]|nr:hypothetical protein [Paracoccaceae bacterium]
MAGELRRLGDPSPPGNRRTARLPLGLRARLRSTPPQAVEQPGATALRRGNETGKAGPVEQQRCAADPREAEDRALKADGMVDPGRFDPVDARGWPAAGPRNGPADVENEGGRLYSAAFRIA